MRIVTVPKDVEQLLVGDLGRIVVKLDALRVIADAAVGGVGRAAARVTNTGADDAG